MVVGPDSFMGPVYHGCMNPTMIGNLTMVLPCVPVVIGLAGVIRKKYGARINGPLRVLGLLVMLSALLLFAFDAVPAEATIGATVLRFVRCAVLLALEAFGVTYGIDRFGARVAGGVQTTNVVNVTTEPPRVVVSSPKASPAAGQPKSPAPNAFAQSGLSSRDLMGEQRPL
jgi:hypothetical protein